MTAEPSPLKDAVAEHSECVCDDQKERPMNILKSYFSNRHFDRDGAKMFFAMVAFTASWLGGLALLVWLAIKHHMVLVYATFCAFLPAYAAWIVTECCFPKKGKLPFDSLNCEKVWSSMRNEA